MSKGNDGSPLKIDVLIPSDFHELLKAALKEAITEASKNVTKEAIGARPRNIRSRPSDAASAGAGDACEDGPRRFLLRDRS